MTEHERKVAAALRKQLMVTTREISDKKLLAVTEGMILRIGIELRIAAAESGAAVQRAALGLSEPTEPTWKQAVQCVARRGRKLVERLKRNAQP